MQNHALRFVPFVVCFLLLSTTTTLNAQEASHSLDEGAWALQFGISDLALRSFTGGVISAKRHTSTNRAIRYGLSINGDHNIPDELEESHQRSNARTGLRVHFLSYPTIGGEPDGTIQLFWGIGPSGDYRFVRNSRQEVTQGQHDVWLGVEGVLGAEWFLLPRISLTGEYRSGLQVGRTFRINDQPNEWHMRLGEGVRFGASVYF